MDINIDEFALLNLVINALLISATARLGGYAVRPGRCLLSAAVATAGAAALLFFAEDTYIAFPAKILLWAVTGICGLGLGKWVRKLILFLITSFLFGGGLWALSLLFGEGAYTVGGVMYAKISTPRLLLFAALLYCGVVFCAGRLFNLTGKGGRLCRVRVYRGNRSVMFCACTDSGCSLRDPVSNTPVILAEKDVLDPLLTKNTLQAVKAFGGDGISFLEALPPEEQRRFRLVPCKTVAGDTLLPAFRPDGITVDGKSITGLVALCPHPLRDCGARALLGEL